jgi:hypothetical protein
MGVTLLFSCMRFVLSVEGRAASILELMLVVVALLEFGTAWGVTGGRTAWLYIGLLAAPMAGLLSLFVLVTGAFVGMFGMSLALANLVLLSLSFAKVRRMAIARSQLAKLGDG